MENVLQILCSNVPFHSFIDVTKTKWGGGAKSPNCSSFLEISFSE